MANKRMFSKQITSSDAFVDMPASSQLLYFHLNMEADDDGFVGNPKRVVRMLNVSDDDFKILIAKRFILAFENGVIVIKHWLLHNAVRKDMYQQTQYLDEKNTLMIKDNNVYTEVRNESVTSPLHRLDKIRLDKIRLESEVSDEIETKPVKFSVDDVRMVDLLVSLIQQNTPSWSIRGSPDKWAEDINKIHRIDGRTYEQIEYMIRWTQKDSFWSQNILSASKLREKFNDLIPRLKGRVKELNYIL